MTDAQLIKLLADTLQDLAFCAKHGSPRQLWESARKAECVLKIVDREI